MVQLRRMPQLPSVSMPPPPPPGTPLQTGLTSSDFIRASSQGVRDGPDGGPPPVFLPDLLMPSIFSFAKKINITIMYFFFITSGFLRTVLNCLKLYILQYYYRLIYKLFKHYNNKKNQLALHHSKI